MSDKERKAQKAIDKMTVRYQNAGMDPNKARDRARETARRTEREKK